MYDSSFDTDKTSVPRIDRGLLWALRISAAILVIVASSAGGQMPNTPVLQNVWANPGMVAAFNLAGGSSGSLYAAAGTWSPPAARFQLSGGIGVQSQTAGTGSSAAYGVRIAMPLASPDARFGFGFFAGVGGGGGGTKRMILDSLGHVDSTQTVGTRIPVGASLGWRQGIGASHGFSLYTSPMVVFSSGGSQSRSVFRVSVGADAGITSSMGLTAGLEMGGGGSSGGKTSGAGTGTLYGVGLSYAFGHR